jgi:thiol-disulfide isomerase/thioredoxin
VTGPRAGRLVARLLAVARLLTVARLLATALTCIALTAAVPTLERAPAPDFTARSLEGRDLRLASLRLQGPVIVEFWATWCDPCREALTELESWRKQYGPRGLSIVAVSVDGPRNISKVRPYIARLRVGYPVVIDDDQRIQRLYQANQMPTSFLVDRAGNIAAVRVGYRRGDTSFATRIESLFKADSTASDSAR